MRYAHFRFRFSTSVRIYMSTRFCMLVSVFLTDAYKYHSLSDYQKIFKPIIIRHNNRIPTKIYTTVSNKDLQFCASQILHAKKKTTLGDKLIWSEVKRIRTNSKVEVKSISSKLRVDRFCLINTSRQFEKSSLNYFVRNIAPIFVRQYIIRVFLPFHLGSLEV